MKTHEISFNSRADLEWQIKTFNEHHPEAKFEEIQINRARAHAIRMDNDGNNVGERLTVKIDYSETVS
jgi:hypothetical protein